MDAPFCKPKVIHPNKSGAEFCEGYVPITPYMPARRRACFAQRTSLRGIILGCRLLMSSDLIPYLPLIRARRALGPGVAERFWPSQILPPRERPRLTHIQGLRFLRVREPSRDCDRLRGSAWNDIGRQNADRSPCYGSKVRRYFAYVLICCLSAVSEEGLLCLW